MKQRSKHVNMHYPLPTHKCTVFVHLTHHTVTQVNCNSNKCLPEDILPTILRGPDPGKMSRKIINYKSLANTCI